MEMHDGECTPEEEADVPLVEPAGEVDMTPYDANHTDPSFWEMMHPLEAYPINDNVETLANTSYGGGI
eukprot:6839190-Pyramimonas_sp.AAC.1